MPYQPTLSTHAIDVASSGGGIYSQMHLPEPNLLIPERFDLLGGSNKKISEEQQRVLLSKPPRKFRDDEKWTIWHKLDRSFNQPKVYAILLLGDYPPLLVILSLLPEHRIVPFLTAAHHAATGDPPPHLWSLSLTVLTLPSLTYYFPFSH